MPRKRSIFADNEWLAINLSAMMDGQGVSNARLARWLGVSREIVGLWRKGEVNPTAEHFDALCAALQCTVDDLLKPQDDDAPEWLPMAAWARREGIPTQRAKDLFELRILTGERITPYTTLVPAEVTAPEDSKNQVLMAKRRPRWVPTFHENFPRLVKNAKLTYTALGELVGVHSSSVAHWAYGRNYPARKRLEPIANALGVSMHALIGDMRL